MRRGSLLLVVVALGSIAGCSSKQDEVAEAPEPTSTSTSAAATAEEPQPAPAAADAPPAESSLSIKRGVVTTMAQGASFQLCNEQAQLWLVDQTDGVLKENFTDSQTSPAKLYVEAYGERTSDVENVPAARGYNGSFVLEEVLYAAVHDDAASKCAGPAPTYVVAARGNEPSWSVEVSDERMLWRQTDAPKELTFLPPQTEDAEGAVLYRAEREGHKLELTIDAMPCRDPLSGEFFAYAAQAVLDDKPFIGCARLGR